MNTSSSSQYPPSTTACPHLNKMLDPLHLPDASSPSCTFTLPIFTTNFSLQTTTSMVPTAAHLFTAVLFVRLFLFCCSSSFASECCRHIVSTSTVNPRSPAKGTQSSKTFSTAPYKAGTTMKSIVHTAVYKQKLHQNNNSLKVYEKYLNQLLLEQAAELDKIIQNINTLVTQLKPL